MRIDRSHLYSEVRFGNFLAIFFFSLDEDEYELFASVFFIFKRKHLYHYCKLCYSLQAKRNLMFDKLTVINNKYFRIYQGRSKILRSRSKKF